MVPMQADSIVDEPAALLALERCSSALDAATGIAMRIVATRRSAPDARV